MVRVEETEDSQPSILSWVREILITSYSEEELSDPTEYQRKRNLVESLGASVGGLLLIPREPQVDKQFDTTDVRAVLDMFETEALVLSFDPHTKDQYSQPRFVLTSAENGQIPELLIHNAILKSQYYDVLIIQGNTYISNKPPRFV